MARARLERSGFAAGDVRCDLIGIERPSWRRAIGRRGGAVRSARARGRPRTVGDVARRIGEEVETLYTNGPAGGGGATRSIPRSGGDRVNLHPSCARAMHGENRGRLMKLWQIAHARSGDKGTISNISLIAFRPHGLRRLVRHVTAARVRGSSPPGTGGAPIRAAVDRRAQLRPLRDGGGGTRTLALDAHGKSLSSALLDMEIPDDDDSRLTIPS